MTRARLLKAIVGCAVATVALCPVPVALAATRTSWVSGTVSDPVGHRIPGAAVRVDRPPGSPAVLTAITNGTGEFFLSGLAPGLYVLTASKAGYTTATSKFNTLIQTSIALTLPPLLGEMRPEGEETPAPPDRAWALRLPRRDLLREEGASAAPAANPGPSSPTEEAAADDPSAAAGPESQAPAASVGGEFRQLFALAGSGRSAGQASQVDVGAALDESVGLTLAGLADDSTLGGAGSAPGDKELTRRQARLGARFDPSAADTVEVSALLADRRYDFQPGGAASPPVGYEQQVQGYAARWERDLGTLGEMDVALDYRSVEVAPGPGEGTIAPPAGPGAAENELWQTAASYRVDLDDRRQMKVGLRARRLQVHDPSGLALSAFEETGAIPSVGREEWALDLSGSEQRSLSGPLSLDYGFNYHRRADELFAQGSSAFIPEAGVTLSQADGTRWSAGISLALDRPEGSGPLPSAPTPAAQDSGLLSRVGYRLAMDRPFPRLGMRVGLNATYHPYAYGPPGDESAPLEIRTPLRRSLMLSEGNAQSLEVGVRLEKRLRNFVAAVGSQWGQVEGLLMTGYFDEVPVQQVSYSLVRYVVSSARGYFPDTGTLLHADYQRYVNNPGQDIDPASLSYLHQRVDVALEQELPFVTLWNARWRLLAAFQTLHTDGLRGTDLASLRASGVRESENRLSGGLAIRF